MARRPRTRVAPGVTTFRVQEKSLRPIIPPPKAKPCIPVRGALPRPSTQQRAAPQRAAVPQALRKKVYGHQSARKIVAPHFRPTPHVSHAKTARIVVVNNGAGLSRDSAVVAAAFRRAGWSVTFVDPRSVSRPALARAEVNVHLERVVEGILDTADRNVFVPNPEWWSEEWTPLLARPDVTVWAKTEDAARVFEELGARAQRVGFSSLDHRNETVPRERAFLHVSGMSPNKGTEWLIARWRADWPKLTVVTPRALGQPAKANVTVLERVSEEALRDLQNRHAFHVYPSRYEGFGHAQWEGLSCGAVVVATDAPPFSEYPEAFKLLEASSSRAPGQRVSMRDAAEASLAEAVAWAVALTDDELQEARARGRAEWEGVEAFFQERIARAIGGGIFQVSSASSPKALVVIHSQHDHCGIREYGRQLDEALARRGAAPFPLTFTSSLEDVQAATGAETTILVHFEPALWPAHYANVLRAARRRGAKVVMCCHWFEPKVATQYGDFVDRFVVHRGYGGKGKLTMLPLGCPAYDRIDRRVLRRRLRLPEGKIILTTAGFLSPWKQYPQLLEALPANFGDDLFLQILTPVPFSGDKGGELAKMRAAVSRFKPENIFFSTEFRPETELLDRIAASDLGFVFHGQNTGSVSAATKQFVSARCPVVVTSSTHASDIGGGTLRVKGFDARDFANALIGAARNREQLEQMRAGMEQEYQRLCIDTVAGQYLDLFRSLR